jgi:hypothetical protein
MTAATAAAETATAAAETTAEVVETVIDNSGKTLAFVAAVAGGALAVGWLVRRFGESAMDAAAGAGHFDPPVYEPAPHTPDIPGDDDEDQGDDDGGETGDGSWAR